jgi:7-cyano-7-deazaguanine synthase
MEPKHKSVVLLSGGLDSIVNLRAAWEEAEGSGKAVLALSFDYGQMSWPNEAIAAKNAATALGVEHRSVLLPFYYPLLEMLGHAFRDGRRIRKYDDAENVKDTAVIDVLDEAWVPGRNLVLLAVGAAFAEAEGFDQVVIGINAEEGAAFPDNRQPFLDAATAAMRFSSRTGIKVRSYTEAMTKEQIIRAGMAIGAPIQYFYSCYLPDAADMNCGRCQSCLRVKDAMKAAGVWDEFKGRFKA